MYPHRIRLREPWTREPHDGGGTSLRRAFHRPTIADGERVWIVCEGATAAATVSLDDAKLGTVSTSDGLWCSDVTERLVDRHELTFEFDVPCESLPWREVRLEIRLHSTPDEDAA